ncbi:unnamed protein product [Hyaloperonospora brassicae]|uniref:RxLR effector candidate protein n=1 Tax=Hyaloperonospora brassicae TaxID=162125 RepID=A0AAV0TI29_HYABA|nr:unnamed protein product [Hyaloperonospora brassicae]
MKCTVFLVAAIGVLGVVTAADQAAVKTPAEALEQIRSTALPDGVALTGTTEKIDPPATAAAVAPKGTDVKEDKQHNDKEDSADSEDDDDDTKKELFGFGWGGYGPYRFGFTYGGIGGWAYPLNYWNTFGSGLIGGGCGLGIPFGGLYYC